MKKKLIKVALKHAQFEKKQSKKCRDKIDKKDNQKGWYYLHGKHNAYVEMEKYLRDMESCDRKRKVLGMGK